MATGVPTKVVKKYIKMQINQIIEYLLSIPKSFYVSWRLTKSLKNAIKLPVIVRYNTILKSLKGNLEFNFQPIKTGIVRCGFGCVGIFDKKYQRSILEISGQVIISGKCFFGTGSRICVMEKGILEIGNNFNNTAKITVVCAKNIKIESDVLTSWDTFIMDTDFHHIINTNTNKLSIMEKPISIGKNVWIGMHSVVLKGSEIADGCIVGACSLVSGKFDEQNCLLAGDPAKIIKKNITRNE